MGDYFNALIKGSKTNNALRLAVIVTKAESNEVFYKYREMFQGDNETSAREEYLAILLAVKSVPNRAHITIYTNKLTAVKVFSSIWNAKKHTGIVEEFLLESETKDVKIKYACECNDEEIKQGMAGAEKYCRGK